MERNTHYAPGTVGKVGEIILMKWSEAWWSAWDGRERVWSTTALRAMRLAQSR